MQVKLSHAHQITFDSLFHHPIAHNLEWRKLLSLLQEIGDVVDEHNGNVKVIRNGHSLVLHPSKDKDVTDLTELIKIRHFLLSSRSEDSLPDSSGTRVLVVIDHREARIFQTETSGAVSKKLVPYDPHGFGRHVHNTHDSAKGQHHPVPKSYFEAVAKSLEGASEILLFGDGKGGGSAMHELVSDLMANHKAIFERIIGSRSVDEQHLTENELLAKAREYFDSPRRESN